MTLWARGAATGQTEDRMIDIIGTVKPDGPEHVPNFATTAARRIKYEWLKFLLEDPHLSQFVEVTKSNMHEARLATIITDEWRRVL